MGRGQTTGTFLALFLIAARPAAAETICETLEAQLRQPVRVLGNSAQIKRQADALARQERILIRIGNDMRRYGCMDGIRIDERDRAQLCAEIGEALVRAKAEQQRLDEARDRALETADDGRERQRIMAALKAHGCLDPAATPAPPPPGRQPESNAAAPAGRGETVQGRGPAAAPSPSGQNAAAAPKSEAPPPQERLETVPDRNYDPNDSRVRVIGPKFLPDAASPLDLKHPALKGAQPQQ